MKKLLISFSGGRTSAYMTYFLCKEWSDRHKYDIKVVFANTGKEVENTLFFVDECSQEWDIPITWIEGYPKETGKGWGVNYKIVNYETASRNGEPFEAMISRIGLPSQSAPFCSPQLKKAPIKSYANSIWRGQDYYIAIGIRVDEQKRINKNHVKNKIIYPLAYINPVTKIDIKNWWDKQSFDLNIHPDDGNCDACWKKSFPTLARIMNRSPSAFDWWQEMTDKYSNFNPRNSELNQSFYRGGKSILDIKKMSDMSQAELRQLTMFDKLDGCAESCEVF